MRRLFLLIGLLATAWAPTVQAQTEPAPSSAGAVKLTAVDVNGFPEIQAYLSIQDAAGQHVAGLPAAAFTLTENAAPIRDLAVLEAELGVQVVFVLDVNEAFKTRDANGVTRWDYVLEALTGFLQTGLRPEDDVSVVTPAGVLIAHVNAAAPIQDALARYAPDFARAADPGTAISAGLTLAADVPPRPGMRRVLVHVGNGLSAEGAADWPARAQAGQVQVHTLFVGPNGAQATTGAQIQADLAAATGGQSLFLEGPASLAPVFTSLAQARAQYRVSYRSTLAVTGQHALIVQVASTSAVLGTATGQFPLRVEPALVALVNPPARVDVAAAGPEYPLPVEVTFPDGHPRSIASVELVVDGAVARTLPGPAESIVMAWPLTGYTVSLTRTVRVQVTDELGLQAVSRAVDVFVEAQPVAATGLTQAALVDEAPSAFPAGWILALTGTSLIVVAGGGLWYWMRRRATWVVTGKLKPAGPPLGQTVPFDPGATMPLPKAAPPARRLQLPPLHFVNRAPKGRGVGIAYLEILESGNGGAARANIELVTPILRLGRDPQLAEAVFPDRSVSRLHARIAQSAPGAFEIFDEGSTSGTWVNFAPVSVDSGQPLKTGDVINIGRVQLRFNLRRPAGDQARSPSS